MHNPLIRAAASLALVAAIAAAIAVVASGCQCESWDRHGNPTENCPPPAP